MTASGWQDPSGESCTSETLLKFRQVSIVSATMVTGPGSGLGSATHSRPQAILVPPCAWGRPWGRYFNRTIQ